MKKALKKSLACVLAALLIFTTLQISAFAAFSEGANGPADYSAYIGADSVKTASADQLATMLLDYLDGLFGRYHETLKADLEGENLDIPTDFSSCNAIARDYYAWLITKPLGGDFDDLDYSSLEGLTRDNGDLRAAYQAIQFLSDNAGTLAKLLTGDFDFGNAFRVFGASEEDEARIKQTFADFDLISLLSNVLDLGDGTIAGWINEQLNNLINSLTIGGTYEETHYYDPDTDTDYYDHIRVGGVNLNAHIDIETDTLYTAIDKFLEALVAAVTEALTGKTFGPDDTFGDYLADLADSLIGEGLEQLNIAESPIRIQRDSLHDCFKNLVDALISNNEAEINKYLDVVNVFMRVFGSKAGLAMIFLGNDDPAMEIDPESVLGQELIAMTYEDNVIQADLVEKDGKTYYVSWDKTWYSNDDYYLTYHVTDLSNMEASLAQLDEVTPEQVEALREAYDALRTQINALWDQYDEMWIAGDNVGAQQTHEQIQSLEAQAQETWDAYSKAEQIFTFSKLLGITDLLNTACHIEVADFDLAANHESYLGYVNQLNHILYVAINEGLAADAVNGIGWVDGGNENFSPNLWKLISWFVNSEAGGSLLDLLGGLTGSDSFTGKVRAAALNSESLAGFAPGLINAIFDLEPSFFYGELGYVPADSTEQIVAFFLNYMAKVITDDAVDYTDAMIADGAFRPDADYKDISFSSVVDLAVYAISRAEVSSEAVTGWGYTFDEYKAFGWTWQEGLDEICDWLLAFIDGALPVTDTFDHERGVLDGNGAWYKVSKILCALLPVGVINGCEKTYDDETLPFDLGVLIEDRDYGGLIDLDFGVLLNCFKINTGEGNPFYGRSLFDAAIGIIQNLINAVFPGALTDELLESMLTAVTADNLVDLIRNICSAIGSRGSRLEAFGIRLLTFFMNIEKTYTDEYYNYDTGEYYTETFTDPLLAALAKVDCIEQIPAVLLAYVADIFEENGVAFPFSYNARVYDGAGMAAGDRAYWKNLTLDMCAEMLTYVMAVNLSDDAGFLTVSDMVAYHDAGWGWEEFLDEIVDWAASYAHGFLAVMDDMSFVRGEPDGGGAFYKLSKILNAILPMAIVNGCASEEFAFDLSVWFDKVYDIATDLRLDYLSEIVRENEAGENPFHGNTLATAVLTAAKNLINGVLPGTIADDIPLTIDGILSDAQMLRIGTNALIAINNRKQYLIPSVLELLAKTGLLDGLKNWLRCGEHNYVRELVAEATCTKPAQYKDVCADCGFSYSVWYDDPDADPNDLIGYHTDLNGDAWCDICGKELCYTAYDPEYGYTYNYFCYHEGDTTLKNGVLPTCTEAGYTGDRFCDRCGAMIVKGENVGANGHSLTFTPAQPASCTEDGNIAYWYCDACRTCFTDEFGENAVAADDTVVEATGHAYGAWTKLDGEKHSRVCANDPNHVETANHTWDGGRETATPTCAAAGEKTFTCTVCGATRTEPIAKLTTHTWDGGRITQDPTCSVRGVKTYTCTVCGRTETEDVATVDHADLNGDGWCDYGCGLAMGGTQNDNDDPGSSSPSFWQKILNFFNRIISFFRNLFNR